MIKSKSEKEQCERQEATRGEEKRKGGREEEETEGVGPASWDCRRGRERED